MEWAALSDTGMRRRNNQDSYNIVLGDSLEAWERAGHLFVVADGMGAHAAGELASRLAADLIPHHYHKHQRSLPADALARSISDSNSEIYRRGQANPEFRNMGTTASVLLLLPEGAIIAHVGDSRVYRLRGQQFDQLTFDHSLVWEMQASGEVNEETIRSGVIPKNVITRSLGPNPNVQVDLEGPFPVRVGDQFLLCSDGLSGQISDEEIGVILQAFPPSEAAQLMIDLANLRGGPDNITVIIVSVKDASAETKNGETGPTQTKRSSPLAGFSVALGVVAAVCFLAAAILVIMRHVPMAIVVAVLGAIAVITGFVQRKSQSSIPELTGDHYGKGPHRRYACKADAKLVEQLLGMVQALREASAENHWKIDWDSVQGKLDLGAAKLKSKNYLQSIHELGLALIEIMKMMRHQRDEDSSASVI